MSEDVGNGSDLQGDGGTSMKGDPGAGDQLPDREEVLPRDHETYTPQGGGSGTGVGPIREVEAAEKASEVAPVKRLPEERAPDGPTPMILPQVGRGDASAVPGDPGPGGEPGKGGIAPEESEVSSFRLIMTLTVAGVIAGALLVFVFLWSQPQIQAYDARVLREAVTEVLHAPERFESVFLHEGVLMTADRLPQNVDTLDLDRVFLGYDQSGEPLGFALQAEGFGFQDIITLIFGYDPGTRRVIGMKVLKHLETPGLGDKIVKDLAFVGEFEGVEAPIEGVKPDRNTGDADQVDMITGATISSKAVIRIINDRIAELGDFLAAYQPTGRVQEGNR